MQSTVYFYNHSYDILYIYVFASNQLFNYQDNVLLRLDETQFAAKIMICNGNAVYLQYWKHNDIYFDWSMVPKFVNFYSQIDMYFGRTYLSMDISTILSCVRHASEGNVKFLFFEIRMILKKKKPMYIYY